VNRTIITIPFRVANRIKNSPAQIPGYTVVVHLSGIELFSHRDTNDFKFPDDTSEWSFTIGQQQWDNLMNRSDAEKANLVRVVSIKYSALGSGRIYKYYFEQSYMVFDNQWQDIKQLAS
jgi:hypothetical protein